MAYNPRPTQIITEEISPAYRPSQVVTAEHWNALFSATFPGAFYSSCNYAQNWLHDIQEELFGNGVTHGILNPDPSEVDEGYALKYSATGLYWGEVSGGGGTGGTSNYNELRNKPTINGAVIQGELTNNPSAYSTTRLGGLMSGVQAAQLDDWVTNALSIKSAVNTVPSLITRIGDVESNITALSGRGQVYVTTSVPSSSIGSNGDIAVIVSGD